MRAGAPSCHGPPAMRPVLALLLSLLIAVPVAEAAKPQKVTCRKKVCRVATKTLPKPSSRPVSGAGLAAFGLDMVLDNPVVKAFVPRQARPAQTNTAKALRRLRAKLPAATAMVTAKASGLNATAGRTTTTTGADGSTSTSTHVDVTDSATGAKGDVDVGSEQNADGTSSVSLDFGLVDRGGSGGSFSLTMPIEHEIANQAKCPTAVGAIDRRRTDHVAVRNHQTRPGFGVDWIDQNIRYQGDATLHGHVGPDAALQTVDYTAVATLNSAYEAKLLLGLIHPDVQVEFEAKASGTLDGRTGRRTATQTTFTGRGRARGRSSASVAAGIAQLLQDQGLRDRLTQLLSDNVDGAFKSLKTAEAGWQVPNACAVMQLSPQVGPADGLDQGQSTTFTGQVEASAKADGGQTAGRWSLVRLDAGTQTGLPGASAAGAPVNVKLTATQDVDRNTVAAGVKLHVTSPAGVAELSWSVGGRDDGPPFYYRVVAGSGTQTVSGRRTTSGGFHIDQTAPVTWTWTNRTTSGPPDGSVTNTDGYPTGQVESGEDEVVGAPWTWRTDEDGGHQWPVDGLTTGGPAVTFDPPGSDHTMLVPDWTNLGIPILEYSIDGPPDGRSYNTLGPDCPPQRYADLATAPIPLSTFAQRRITLSIDQDWDVDEAVSTLGHDVCHGHISATMTLERVAADGSPLP